MGGFNLGLLFVKWVDGAGSRGCWVGLLLEAPRGAGRSVSSSGLLIHSTSKNWNTRLKKTHMIVDIIVAVNTCITSVMNTIFVDLSYLKGKNKE